MNEQIQAIIARARAMLAAATPGPVTVYPHPRPGEGSDESRIQWGDLTTRGRSMWTGIPMADAEVFAFAVNNLGTLCDALEATERRAEEAEACEAAALGCIQSSAHKLWRMPPADRTLATDAVWRDMAYFEPISAGRALLDRLHAAEAERDALRAKVERLRSQIGAEVPK